MSCILRIAGKDLELKSLLRVDLIPDSSWEKGMPRSPSKPDGKKNLNSGANYVVSEADLDEFDLQKMDAIEFLINYKTQIQEIMNLPGNDGGVLDFAISRRDVFVQYDNFPSKLISIAGSLGLSIELSQYPVNDDDEDISEQTNALDRATARRD